MKINKISIDKAANYPRSFYNKVREEQKLYKEKTDKNTKGGNNCLVEEVDCEKSLITLAYSELKYKLPGKPVRKKIKAEDKPRTKNIQENRNPENISTEKKSLRYKINLLEDELCVIEEVDCKLSLISLGYEDTDTETEVDIVLEAEENTAAQQEEETEEVLDEVITQMAEEEQTGDNSEYNTEDELEDNSEDVNLLEFDITRFSSREIIGTVLDYTEDKEDVEEITEEEPEEIREEFYVFQDSLRASDINFEADTVLNEDFILNDEYRDDDKFISGSREDGCLKGVLAGKKELKTRFKEILLREGKFYLSKENFKNLLHFGAIHTKNELGYVSLLALLGFMGIFTDNRACLGFWAFLYYVRYFFVLPDESFRADIIKSAVPAFFINIGISILTIILKVVFQNTVLLIFGMGAAMVISILVFTVSLAVFQMGKKTNVV